MEAYIDRIFYDAAGYTGKSYYFRVIRRHDNYIWNTDSEAFEANTSWANSAIEMEDAQSTGQYPVVIPKDFPSSTYDIVVYDQAGVSPANTDGVETSYQAKVGSIMGF